MKYKILLNSIVRIPLSKAAELVEDYAKNVGFKNFYEQQRVLDILTIKKNEQIRYKEEAFFTGLCNLMFMSKDKGEVSKEAFEDMYGFPMTIWIESIGAMEPKNIMRLLNNYHKEFPSTLIETCIINLPESFQLRAIDIHKNSIDSNGVTFSDFYYSVSKEAREKLRQIFPDKIKDEILLEMEDMNESEINKALLSQKDRLMKFSTKDLVEFILLKATELTTLNKFLNIYSEKINDCPLPMFKLLFTRYRYLGANCYKFDNIEGILTHEELFSRFKDKFHEIGLKETLLLFDVKVSYYSVNKFTVDVILEFLNETYDDVELSAYLNEDTTAAIMNKFIDRCKAKDYSYDDFQNLVKNISDKTKLIHDDYIEAIIACGKLLENRTINDKDSVFLELREKFTNDLIGRCKKDGTYLENISLNGVFYRLAKGSIPFDAIYMIKTYKGLIYLSKIGVPNEDADYITRFLTDEQLVKLNIKPVMKWIKELKGANAIDCDSSFVRRISLQLLCYFGKNKGKYLLESGVQENRMENLIDNLKYQNITINQNGEPNINEELINFLFGRGMMKENNTIINRMIRGDIPVFEKYFPDFCNSFNDIKENQNGVLSLKRIIRYYENKALPIQLKPDEVNFKSALIEMNTYEVSLLNKAINLCKDARNREYSTIPKVEGEIGNFRYKILDLNDPLAVAVGYLSHCCFVVEGTTYDDLKHSMQSENGRTFVVYYNGQFLTQSWVWRNGDVICFDSVEAGCPYHGMYKDDIKLIDVYKQAAREMLSISNEMENDVQKVKVVTIGKSDYKFNDLELVDIDSPRPIEKNLSVYDSKKQYILAGKIPDKIRYGEVGAQYKDPRKKVRFVNTDNNIDIDIDTLDEIELDVNSLKYQIYADEEPIDLDSYSKIILGEDWYILVSKDGNIESGVLNKVEAKKEYEKYIAKYQSQLLINLNNENSFVKTKKLSMMAK